MSDPDFPNPDDEPDEPEPDEIQDQQDPAAEATRVRATGVTHQGGGPSTTRDTGTPQPPPGTPRQ